VRTSAVQPERVRIVTAGEKVIAVDLGTSYFKVCRFDLCGRLEAVSRVSTPISGSDGHAEISVSGFRLSLTQALRDVSLIDGGRQNIVAITFATQANSFALFDARDEPLTPFIVWSDQRAKDLDSPFYELAADDSFRMRTGVAKVNHLFMPLKVSWLREHAPAAIANTKRIALLSDYFSWWLTGEWYSEAATAALSGLVDIQSLTWWDAACGVAEIPIDWLNRIVRTGTKLSAIRSDTANALGLPPNCQFVVGCLDQHAGAIGAGNVSPGYVSETTGTVLATVRCSNTLHHSRPDEVFQGPTFRDGVYYQMVFSEQSAGLLERYRHEKAPDLTYSQLDELAQQSPHGAHGLRLRNDAFYSPTNEMFENWQPEHSQCDEVRAILEGVAYQLRHQVNLLCDGIMPSAIRCAGGGAKSRLWLTIKQQMLGIPCIPALCQEPTALGAALLAISAYREKSLVELLSHTFTDYPNVKRN
jgi:xylulokinase